MTSYGSLLANPRVRRFAIAGSFSYAAPAALVLILVWTIATAPEYAGQLNFVAPTLAFEGLAATIPTLVAAVVSGTLADRMERRRLMRLTNALAVSGMFGIVLDLFFRPEMRVAFPGPSGYFLPLWMILMFPAWAAVSAATTMFRPAYNAALPKLLPSSDLASANGLIFALSIGLSVGASLAATGSLALGTSRSFVAASIPLALLLIAQVALGGIGEDRPHPPTGPRSTFVQDARRGYGYLWRRKALLQLTLTALAINSLTTAAFVELGLYATSTLGVSNAILYGGMVTGSSIGVAIGSLAIGRIRFERVAGRTLALVTAGEGVSVLILGLSHSIWISLPDMVLFGIFPGMYMTVFLATLQATVPNELLGRVLAADEVGSYAMVPVGQYLGGILTLVLGSAQTPFILAGVGTILIGGLMIAFPQLRSLGFDPAPHRTPVVPDPPPTPSAVPGETLP
ncbi:MAG TPA: MFS transporter [Thermoplasmata archaeon]|nr:MFS transporter [Thermoplasmata archaeon]